MAGVQGGGGRGGRVRLKLGAPVGTARLLWFIPAIQLASGQRALGGGGFGLLASKCPLVGPKRL
jgi:hypothetical protein